MVTGHCVVSDSVTLFCCVAAQTFSAQKSLDSHAKNINIFVIFKVYYIPPSKLSVDRIVT